MSCRRHSMTLVELLVGLTLVVVLMAFGFSALREMDAAWGQGRDRFDTRHTARKVVERLSADLRCCAASATDVSFSGRPDSLRFAATLPTGTELLVVDYAVVSTDARSGLRRRVTTRAGEAVSERIESGVTEIAARYRAKDGSWVDSWDSPSPPVAVRLDVRGGKESNSASIPILVAIPTGGAP